MSRHEIAPGLIVCGFGGAVPGYQNGYNVWAHFPYNEHQYGEKLEKVWNETSPTDQEQVLLLTHCGPAEVSSTTAVLYQDNKTPIESGSSNLRRLLETVEMQEKVVVNLHGHTHMSSGMVRVGKVSVVNPGALVEDRYAVMELSKKNDLWQLESCTFKHIL